jgi:hypothetical protein
MPLEFSSDQEEVLHRNARRAEAKRLAPIMRKSMPGNTERYVPPHQAPQHLEDTVFAALERAHEWKLKTHSATVDFVILWLMLGPDFDRAPQVEAVLVSELASVDVQIKALLVELKWHLHQEARQQAKQEKAAGK